MRILTLCLSLLVVSYSAFSRSRIYEGRAADPAMRCANKSIGTTSCEARRKFALERGCISEEEYNDLKKLGSYPLCDPFEGEGLKQFGGYCACGCFAPETLIQVAEDGKLLEKKKSAQEIIFGRDKELEVTHLKNSSILHSFQYDSSPIRVRTFGKESKKIYKIKARGKAPLLLTEKHPILLASGRVVQAKDLKSTDSLVLKEGESVVIEKIERIPFKQDVLNFAVETKTPTEHLIFAEDIVVGDQYWQASLEDLLNQVILREGK